MKSMLSFIALLLVILPVNSYSQAPDTFWTSYHLVNNWYSEGWESLETQDGSVLIVGTTRLEYNSFSRIFLYKIDQNGDSVWAETYGGNADYEARASVLLTDGSFVITGHIDSTNYLPDSVSLIRIAEDGGLIWNKRLCEGEGRSIKRTDDGGFIIAGWVNDDSSNDDMLLIKTDSDGDTIWTRRYGGADNERAWSVGITADGGYIIVGWTESYSDYSDFYTVKTDNIGNPVWTGIYGTPLEDEARSVFVNDDENILIVGKKSLGVQYGNVFYAVYLNPDGDTIWTRSYDGGGGAGIANSVIKSQYGNFVLAGNTGIYRQAWILGIDTTGSLLWNVYITHTSPQPPIRDYARSVIQLSDGNYILVGRYGETGDADLFVCKLETDQSVSMFESNEILPFRTVIRQNYPNPFNANTTISFDLSEPGNAVLSVYDLLGRRIAVLAEGYFGVGTHDIAFDASDLSSGVYFYNLKAGDISETKSMILLK